MSAAVSVGTAGATIADLRAVLEAVRDPEIPILTIADLGVLRNVQIDDGRVVVTITPTYSGCPAMDTIADDIRAALHAAGHDDVSVRTQLAPAWTTDWLTPAAHAKLREVGIAPPVGASGDKRLLRGDDRAVRCPRCASAQTECVSEFGSTACKALYRCTRCREPFDYFKCL